MSVADQAARSHKYIDSSSRASLCQQMNAGISSNGRRNDQVYCTGGRKAMCVALPANLCASKSIPLG